MPSFRRTHGHVQSLNFNVVRAVVPALCEIDVFTLQPLSPYTCAVLKSNPSITLTHPCPFLARSSLPQICIEFSLFWPYTRTYSLLQLRYLQTLNSIAAEHNSTIIFPMPINLATRLFGRSATGAAEEAEAKEKEKGEELALSGDEG